METKELYHVFCIFDGLKPLFNFFYPGSLGHSFTSLSEEAGRYGMLPTLQRGLPEAPRHSVKVEGGEIPCCITATTRGGKIGGKSQNTEPVPLPAGSLGQ